MLTKGRRGKKIKDKISLIKKFLSGEDVVNDILSNGIERITAGFSIVMAKDLDKPPSWADNVQAKDLDQPPSWWNDNLIVLTPVGGLYEDPDIPGVHYSNQWNCPQVDKSSPKTEAPIRKVKTSELSESPKNSLKSDINADWLAAQALQEHLREIREEWIWHDK